MVSFPTILLIAMFFTILSAINLLLLVSVKTFIHKRDEYHVTKDLERAKQIDELKGLIVGEVKDVFSHIKKVVK